MTEGQFIQRNILGPIPNDPLDFIFEPGRLKRKKYLGKSTHLFSFLKEDRGVVTPETEGVAQRCSNLSLLSRMESKVKFRIKVFIVGEVVNGRWDHSRINGHNRGHCFNSTSRTKEVTCHTLRR